MFLGKPKDDLRKDARIMDLNSIINKLLKANSESRRRQLREFCPEDAEMADENIYVQISAPMVWSL